MFPEELSRFPIVKDTTLQLTLTLPVATRPEGLPIQKRHAEYEGMALLYWAASRSKILPLESGNDLQGAAAWGESKGGAKPTLWHTTLRSKV